MSGRRKVGDGDVEIMVIRSSDGKKANVRRSFVSSEALFLTIAVHKISQSNALP